MDGNFDKIVRKNIYQHILMMARPTLFLLRNRVSFLNEVLATCFGLILSAIIIIPLLAYNKKKSNTLKKLLNFQNSIFGVFNYYLSGLILDSFAIIGFNNGFGFDDEIQISTHLKNYSIAMFVFWALATFIIARLEISFKGCNLTRIEITWTRYFTIFIKILLSALSALDVYANNLTKTIISVSVILYFVLEGSEIYLNQPFMNLKKIRVNSSSWMMCMLISIVAPFYLLEGEKEARKSFQLQTIMLLLIPVVCKLASRYMNIFFTDLAFMEIKNEKEMISNRTLQTGIVEKIFLILRGSKEEIIQRNSEHLVGLFDTHKRYCS
jgi:hypothetical protein